MDVSERKQVEALVIESEKRFRAIFNETSHFIGVLDVRGKILELNEQGFEFFGLTPNNSLGKYLWEIPNWAHNESSQKRIREVIEAVQQGATMRYEVEVRDRNNAPAFLDFTLKPVPDMDGNVAMMIADSRDITAYKIAEEKRVEYERRYDALFSNTADAVFIFTLDGYYITANERGLAMLGYTLEKFDHGKDQSYVLHVLTQEKLRHALFPLEEYTKPEIRQFAGKYGLPTASRKDSQDLCFLAGEDYRNFLQRNAANMLKAGEIVTREGTSLGVHNGLANYTIGQRKGLGIASSVPLFVLGKDAAHTRLVIGTLDELGSTQLISRNVNWVSGDVPREPFHADVKIRYTAKEAQARVTPIGEDQAQVTFDAPQRDITAGQAAVFFQSDLLVGGGIIV